jgi:predicted TIM-barrel fold metal-dependent hydrolase
MATSQEFARRHGRSIVDMDDLILVSVDDHVVEPPDMFEGRLPARLQDLAPRVVKIDDTDVWEFNDRRAAYLGLNAVVGRPPDEWGLEPTAYGEFRAGCYDVHERVKDMNANGVLGSLNFPSFPRFCGQLFAETAKRKPELAKAVVEAYNDWHLDAWVGSHPDRFIGCSIPMLWDPALAAAEIRRCAAKGCHAVTFSMNPYALGLPSLHDDHWDPFWEACEETETNLCMHIGSDSRSGQTSPDAPMNVRITCSGINIYPTAADLVWSPIFRKFPGIKVALAEGGIGWIPYFLERVDYTFDHHQAWTQIDIGERKPSQIFNDHIITCFIDDAFGAENVRRLNVDMVCWECDYPHSDCTWPNSPEEAYRYLKLIGDDEIVRKVTHENAMRLFQFDPFTTRRREDSTVGALRAMAKDHDISIVSKGKKEHAVTIGAKLVALELAPVER